MAAQRTTLKKVTSLEQFPKAGGCGQKHQPSAVEKRVRAQPLFAEVTGDILQASRPSHDHHLLPDFQTARHELQDFRKAFFFPNDQTTYSFSGREARMTGEFCTHIFSSSTNSHHCVNRTYYTPAKLSGRVSEDFRLIFALFLRVSPERR